MPLLEVGTLSFTLSLSFSVYFSVLWQRILDGMSFTVPAGQNYAIVGGRLSPYLSLFLLLSLSLLSLSLSITL